MPFSVSEPQESSTCKTTANQVTTSIAASATHTELPSVTNISLTTNWEGNCNSMLPRVAPTSEANTSPKRPDAMWGNKRKDLPSTPDTYHQVDCSRARTPPMPTPASNKSFPPQLVSSADVTSDTIPQNVDSGHPYIFSKADDRHLIRANMEIFQSNLLAPERRSESSVEASITDELSDLTDLDNASPMTLQTKTKRSRLIVNRKTRRTANATPGSTAIHTMTTRAAKRRKQT